MLVKERPDYEASAKITRYFTLQAYCRVQSRQFSYIVLRVGLLATK